jgi:hypothetical protein
MAPFHRHELACFLKDVIAESLLILLVDIRFSGEISEFGNMLGKILHTNPWQTAAGTYF